MSKINVLIADDSGVMRLLISDILRDSKNINVIGVATNGKDAVEKVIKLKPDVLLLDMLMGEYDGIYAIEKLMKNDPLPIVVLSALGNSDMTLILEALKLGAFDYLNKPDQNNSKIREIKGQIEAKIENAYNVDREKLGFSKIKHNSNPHSFIENLPYNILLIGASTGGPTAIEKILTKLPSNMPIPVVIVQHMPENFVPSFVKRLNNLTPLNVVLGEKGTLLTPGKVIVSPGGKNMILKHVPLSQVEIAFTSDKHKEYNYPSINSVFLSAAKIYNKNIIATILTGMGKDGAMGMIEINNKGGLTVAQDQKTSIVYGMPREVVLNQSAKYVVPIQDIGGFIVSSLS